MFDGMPRWNIMSGNIMITAYLEMGNTENAKKLFDEMTKRNVATWNGLMVTWLTSLGLIKSLCSCFQGRMC